ncbi:outer mitochondrial transmembrane helix translocase-like isoform X2 [Artemia franciscana]|uniref:AAA+ ATPase domain-containing protein n=2 Tax=Artemia franciscana TaxID=6661 RepID=A0AA88H6T5_ARTSF|nr:hypothetical protein QYM36_018333 [Artemia franciscana]KAK2703129.1 hypothetical protein QYM36_018333 [Artemia franciscana]KAK2703130.1 hypothetical protein QYM36_018333 [Artemia franciscana]KAK2703131.1 hypothetical protein QYM36_018333 [Artemia franciscana]KAK2703132.1 hypothetical protein QYM36_018333 [Artemia franciscana]
MVDGGVLDRSEVLSLIVRVAIAGLGSYLTIRYLGKFLDPSYAETEKARKQTELLLKKLDIRTAGKFVLTNHETRVAANLIVPREMGVSFGDIGGYEEVTLKLLRRVIQPIKKKDKSCTSSLAAPPKGVLLYGPPGCGKTMIAKALAKESGMNFINLNIADITDKWYGESNKMAVAVFSLAYKISPCIIFIDEIDCFLSIRGSSDHEATSMMKSIFMSAWDGLITDKTSEVIVIGATNRMSSVDPAILRRMPTRFHIDLPDRRQRLEVLKIILKDENVNEDIIVEMADRSNGLSCADLTEVCRTAVVEKMNDLYDSSFSETAAVTVEDHYFFKALDEVLLSRGHTRFYPLD